MDQLPRLALLVGAALVVAGVTAAGAGVYREATFECDDTLSLTRTGPAGAGATVTLGDRSTGERRRGERYRGPPADAVCSPESTPRLASLLERGGAALAGAGAVLAVPAAVWRRSERVRSLLR